MNSYPKWVYHSSEPARVVADAVEQLSLGEGWVESPADVDAPAPASEKPAKKAKKDTVN